MVEGSNRATARAARRATAAVFFVSGAAAANWFVRIPAVQERLGLSPGVLGLALLGIAVGSLVAMPPVGWLVARLGSRPVTHAAAIAICLVLPLPALAPNLPLLVASLFLFGASAGAIDVSMNAQAVAVEQRYRRPIMSSFHALYSLGALAGAAAGSALAGLGVGPATHLLGVAAPLLAVAALAPRRMLPAGVDAVQHGPRFARPTRSLAGLGLIAFCVLLAEGAMADWSAVYLRRVVETGPGLAGAGFTAFSLAMTAGRLAGDRLAAWLGGPRAVRLGGLTAAAGLGLALAIPAPVAALVGFAGIGAGISFIFPLVLSGSAQASGMAPSVAIAALSTAGYFGFLAGPPTIGLLAEAVTLRGSLGVVVALCLLVAALAGRLDRSDPAGDG